MMPRVTVEAQEEVGCPFVSLRQGNWSSLRANIGWGAHLAKLTTQRHPARQCAESMDQCQLDSINEIVVEWSAPAPRA